MVYQSAVFCILQYSGRDLNHGVQFEEKTVKVNDGKSSYSLA